jgi:hypothetical protein
MNVDANIVIDKLGNQIKEMSKALAIKDAQIELLQAEIATLSVKE